MPKKKNAKANKAPSISEIVDMLEKAANTNTAATTGLQTRLKDVIARAPRAITREEFPADSALAGRLAKVLHQLKENTARVETITATVNI